MVQRLFTATIMLLFAICFFGCSSSSDNPAAVDLNDPSTFPGTYKLATLVDKLGNILGDGQPLTIEADRDVTITLNVQGFQVSAIVRVSGTIMLTETTYSNSQTVTITAPVVGAQTQTITDSGTYSVNGSSFTMISNDPNEGTTTTTISVEGRRITVDGAESTIVYEKQ